LEAGDTYVLALRADATAHPIGAGAATYDVVSAVLTIEDGGALMVFGPGGGGDLYLTSIPDQSCLFALAHQYFDMPPFDGVRFALLDDDGDPVLGSTDLPPSLDLDAFTGQRELALIGEIDTGDGPLYPIAHASIDSFSARFVPGPGGISLALACGASPLRRRRRNF
jgi:hypothetical protein